MFWLRFAVHSAALAPLAMLIWDFWQNRLGPDVVGEMSRRTGRYALAFLILSLTPTVIAAIGGWSSALQVRRALGIYALAYAALHFLVFIGLDYGFDLRLIVRAILEGRFVLVGLAALVILVPLAVTSTDGWVRRLGRNWKRLHRLTYLAGGLAVLHYAWRFKELRTAPLLAGAALLVLLLVRIPSIAKALGRWRHSESTA